MSSPAQPPATETSRGFELFDLSVTLGPNLVPWVSAASRLGHVHGIPRADSGIPPLSDLLDSVYDFVDAVQFAERETLPDLGPALKQIAFGDPSVTELFQATRGVAAEHGRELLVRLLASPHLAALPWELLPDPGKSRSDGDGGFLALAPDVSLVRLARGRTYPIRVERLDPPLNLLVVLSSPSGRDPADDSLAFDIYEERRALLSELDPLVDAGLLRVDVEDQPTLQNLRRRIGAQRRGYHLFHYLGHAEPDKLILEDESGRRQDHRASRFMEVLRLCPDLRLAVFAGCETARAAGDPLTVDLAAVDGWRNILSLADRCVQESCPVVVGMQAVLSFRTERLFTRFFYQGIASGYSVTGAMRLARGATRGDRHVGGDLLDWSVPALFVGGTEPGALIDRSTPGIKPEKHPRHVLRLGLRQRETRFFARDVALRQAIDVLSGDAPEHVLVLTGPPGVGKTMLIDRALEEIGGPVSILYVCLDDMAPELAWIRNWERGARPEIEGEWWAKRTAHMNPEAALETLCLRVAELLARADGRQRERGSAHKPVEWWERLIEDIAQRRFVLVIDNIDVLFKVQKALARLVVEYWFSRQVAAIGNESGGRSLQALLEDLVNHAQVSSGYTQRPGGPVNPLISGLGQLFEWLAEDRLNARAAVVAEGENWIRFLEFRTAADSATPERKEQREREQEVLRAAAKQIDGLRRALDSALCIVAERRSGLRVALAADSWPKDFLALPSTQVFHMRLGRLTWFETWRWIRRNLPGLLRYGEEYLERLWPRLSAELELWEELERRILEAGAEPPEISTIVDAITRRPSARRTSRPGRRPKGERPLRVAVVGPHIVSADALALAVTRLAVEHNVGGRAVSGADEESGSLAVLVKVPSPFKDGATATEFDVAKFLQEVIGHEPDIILLDYGYQVALPLENSPTAGRRMIDNLSKALPQTLLIAAGGNKYPGETGMVTAPAVFPEVLAVGSIDSDGKLPDYAEWTPELSKPDVFMVDQLAGTALEGALKDDSFSPADNSHGLRTMGSSFAAIHAMATAVLVWSMLPDFTPKKLRELLRRASRSIKTKTAHGPQPFALTVRDAVAEARKGMIREALADGLPSPLQALAAATGLELRLVGDVLAQLEAQGEIRHLTRGRLERYELVTNQ